MVDLKNPNDQEAAGQRLWYQAYYEFTLLWRNAAYLLFDPSPQPPRYQAILELMNDYDQWRERNLGVVGIPSPFPVGWTFVAAIGSCTAEILSNIFPAQVYLVLQERGIYEEKHPSSAVSPQSISVLRSRIQEDALSGVLKVSSLIDLFTSNHYMRLDSKINVINMFVTARTLIHFKRKELIFILKGYLQVAEAFEEFYLLCEELRELGNEYMDVDAAMEAHSNGDLSFLGTDAEDDRQIHQGQSGYDPKSSEDPDPQFRKLKPFGKESTSSTLAFWSKDLSHPHLKLAPLRSQVSSVRIQKEKEAERSENGKGSGSENKKGSGETS